MKVTKVCCQGCGADLEIDETIRYVTCNYCNARLEVVHDSTVTHTRQLEKIERTTDQLANKVKILELQNDLERLDREWEMQRQSLQVRDSEGHASQPSATGSIIAGVMATVFGVIWMSVAAFMPFSGFFLTFGLLFIGFAIFGVIKGIAAASAYRDHHAEYETRRQQISHLIAKERNS